MAITVRKCQKQMPEMAVFTRNCCKTLQIPGMCQISIGLLSGWWLSHASEKYEFVSWDHYSQYMAKLKKCSKPPTRFQNCPYKIPQICIISSSTHFPPWKLPWKLPILEQDCEKLCWTVSVVAVWGKEQPKRRRTSACTWGYASLPERPHIEGEIPIWMGLVSQGGAPPSDVCSFISHTIDITTINPSEIWVINQLSWLWGTTLHELNGGTRDP